MESTLRTRICDLQKQIQNLKKENHALQNEKDNLSCEVANMKASQESPDFELPDPSKDGVDTSGAISDEAARKRLWRLCKKGADGILGLIPSARVLICPPKTPDLGPSKIVGWKGVFPPMFREGAPREKVLVGTSSKVTHLPRPPCSSLPCLNRSLKKRSGLCRFLNPSTSFTWRVARGKKRSSSKCYGKPTLTRWVSKVTLLSTHEVFLDSKVKWLYLPMSK